MYISNYKDTPAEWIEGEAKGVKIRWVLTEANGASNFVMRHFEIIENGYTPLHKHPWEHEIFILNGEGIVVTETMEKALKHGDAVFIPGDEIHQFKNTRKEPLTMLCLIPARGKC